MSAKDEDAQQATAAVEGAAAVAPATGRFADLAELEQEIRLRLRSNRRFLEQFLDEDFVDDEEGGDEPSAADDEEL